MRVNQFPDRKIIVNGSEFLYFGGTSYLGLATNVEFQDILQNNVRQWGSFYGSSRNANVILDIYDQFETYFASFLKKEAVASISSGTLAGKLAIEVLENEGYDFFHYPKTHPAIVSKKSNLLFINDELHPKIKNKESQRIVITADAMLSGEVTPTDFAFLDKISKAIKITLLIDESHSLGLIGEQGSGLGTTIDNKNIERLIITSSLGKALGVAGGIIATDKAFIKKIKETATFTSSSGASPGYLAAFIQTEELYIRQRERLEENLDFVASHLKMKSNYKFNKNYPVIYINSTTIFEKLLEEQIVITSFEYPTYKKRMNRIVITSNHTKQDLQTLITILNDK